MSRPNNAVEAALSTKVADQQDNDGMTTRSGMSYFSKSFIQKVFSLSQAGIV